MLEASSGISFGLYLDSLQPDVGLRNRRFYIKAINQSLFYFHFAWLLPHKIRSRRVYLNNPISPAQLVVLCVTIASVIGDLPPGTRRNTYLPPEPTKGSGYTYSKPTVPFPKPTPTVPTYRPTPSFPGTRPTPSFPVSRPTPSYPVPPSRPTPGTFPPSTGTGGYPSRPRPTPPFPDYTSQQSGRDGSVIGGPGVSTC